MEEEKILKDMIDNFAPELLVKKRIYELTDKPLIIIYLQKFIAEYKEYKNFK